MGLETLVLAQLAVSAVSTIAQVGAQNRAIAARKEGQTIQGAGQEISNRLARRRAAKEERIRRAALASGAEAAGVTGSSGLLGAQSALVTSFGTSLAEQQSKVLTAEGISKQSEKEANAISFGKSVGAFGDLAQTALKLPWE